MAMSITDKLKVTQYLNEHKIDDLNYNDLRNAIANNRCGNKDICLYFIDYIEEKLSEDKINVKIIGKMLLIIDCLIEKNIAKFDDNTISKVLNLSKLYELFLARTSEEKDENIAFYLNKLGRYKSKIVMSEEPNEKSSRELELEIILNKLKNKIISHEQEYEKLKRKYEQDENTIADKRTKIKGLKVEITELNDKIKELQNTINEYVKCIKGLEGQIEYLEEKAEETTNNNKYLTEKCESLLKNIEDLKQQLQFSEAKLSESLEGQRKKELEEEKENIIKGAILDKIYTKGYNFGSLSKELRAEGYIFSEMELYNLLMRINENISIIDESYFPPRYKLLYPEVKTNESLTINTFSKNCYDIFLTSDFHIGSLEEIEKYNVVYDYCSKNGIELILNLGDFIDGISYTEDKIIQRDYYLKISDQIIENFPKSPNINQVILGGNHDRKALYLSLNVLKIISKARKDFINIGYDNARIYIDKDTHPLVLHHFKEKIEAKDSLMQKIDDYYNENALNPDETYLNFAGHLHKSSYNYNDNYCLIPSLTHDRYINGAWHLKVYFNDDGTINYLILVPLMILDNKLIPTNEIVHERKLVK